MIHTHDLIMATANSTSKEDLIVALCHIASIDSDFNGANGDEYLWYNAKVKGFETNMDYVVSMLPDTKDVKTIISNFFEWWVGKDNYYDSYDYDYTLLDNGKVVIAFSYVHEN